MRFGRTRLRAALSGATTAALAVGALVAADTTFEVLPRPGAALQVPPVAAPITAPLSAAKLAELLSEQAPGVTAVTPAPDVLTALPGSAPAPDAAMLRDALAPLATSPALGRSVSVDVVDAVTGQSITGMAADVPRAPASTLKIFTAAAALTALGPDATLQTRAVSTAAGDGVVLVGGGDVLLGAGAGHPVNVVGRAGLGDLAQQTAAALKAQSRTQVRLAVDDTLFQGPAISPLWKPDDVKGGYVAPVMALEVNAGRKTAAKYSVRVPDPALAAGAVFAAELKRNGIAVTGTVARGQAEAQAPELGSVSSAPIADIVQLALTESDNTVAEALARLVAWRAGQPTTFAGGGEAILSQLSALGIPVEGSVVGGGSGLGKGNAVTVKALTGVLTLATMPGQPALRRLLPALPVAGASGTLADRFGAAAGQPGLGVVRAKTGTLSGVTSLAGTVVDADGRLLVFALIANDVPNTTAAEAVIDRFGAVLAGCGCH